ncbi:MAG: alpha-L-fucosidase [Marinilabiliaceae bacterium]|jgi:alpha-L-fucosidase|nr:alpha-L-fucosidase [Marinilabiliaceae bacterium]
MSKQLPLLILLAIFVSSCTSRDPQPLGPVPSERQLAWHDMQYYMFVHFTVNTFTDKEWGFGDESPGIFNPSEMDVDQWARVAREAGMKGIIITAKHHDGFCLWPSAYTEHSIKNSPYKDGKGDILRELRVACDKYGLKMGVYLSPWDRNHAAYGSPEYLEYYRAQLSELLSNYGDIFEVWFDGANGGTGYYGGAGEQRNVDRKSYYDWENTWPIIRELQPMAVMFSDAGPDIRWVGNESGLGSPTNWCLLNRDEFYPGSPNYEQLGEGHEDGTHWVPAEVDVSIRPGWFYHESEDEKVKSPEKLMEIYYSSIGRNANLLLNVPPDRRGLIHENDVKALMEFRRMLDEEFKENLAAGKNVKPSEIRSSRYNGMMVTDADPETFWTPKEGTRGGTLEIDLFEPVEINRILIQEYIKLGQHIKEFKVEALIEGKWEEISEGTTVGYKVIKKFPLILSDKIRLVIKDSKSAPAVSNIELYRAPGE